MRHFRPLVFLLLCSMASAGEPAKAVIQGPTGGVPGDLILLDATASTGKYFKWLVHPQLPGGRQTIVLVEGGRKAFIASVPGQYSVTLAVGNEDGIDLIVYTVTITATGQPAPQPPTVPTPVPDIPLIGLSQVVRNSITKNIPVADRGVAIELGKAYRQGAEMLVKGEWTTANAPQMQAQLNRIIAGFNATTWNPVFVDIANKLGEARTAGKLATVKQWVAAWSELSVAFATASVQGAAE